MTVVRVNDLSILYHVVSVLINVPIMMYLRVHKWTTARLRLRGNVRSPAMSVIDKRVFPMCFSPLELFLMIIEQAVGKS